MAQSIAMPPSLILAEFLPYRLSVASNAVSTRISSAYRRRFGLKIAEWRLIAILAEHADMTPVMLAEAARMDKVTISRASAALIDRGLIVARTNEDDRRSHRLELTSDGASLYAEIAPLALATETALFATLSAAERTTLASLLRRVEAAAEEHTPPA